MPRQNDSQRAARDYMKAHPGTTYRQALAIVTGKTAAAPTVQGVVLEGYAEGWSNADLNALIATMGELVREGALEPYTDILSTRQIEVAEKCHDLWVQEHANDEDDAPLPCEVDDCDHDAYTCPCGAAHCDLHPHINDEERPGKCDTCGGDISDYEPGTTQCVWCTGESDEDDTNEYLVHLSLDHEEATGVGSATITAQSLDRAIEAATERFGENVVLVEGPDGSREML